MPQTGDDPPDRLALEDSLYCPFARQCPYAQDLPEDQRDHPVRLITTGDPILANGHLTPALRDAIEGREYRCAAIDLHEGPAQQCAITQSMGLAHTAMRFGYQLYRALREGRP